MRPIVTHTPLSLSASRGQISQHGGLNNIRKVYDLPPTPDLTKTLYICIRWMSDAVFGELGPQPQHIGAQGQKCENKGSSNDGFYLWGAILMTCIRIQSMPNAFNRYEVNLTCLKSSIGGWNHHLTEQYPDVKHTGCDMAQSSGWGAILMTCISIQSMPNTFNRYKVDLTCLKRSIGGWNHHLKYHNATLPLFTLFLPFTG